MTKYDRVKEFANILSSARYEAKISQERMAVELGVSRATVQNYEAGTSFPDIFKMSEWFKICGVNPTKYYLQYFNYDTTNGIKGSDSDEKVLSALHETIDTLSIEESRALMYLLFGSHGSNPHSVLQMLLANLHCPMRNRVAIARQIVDNYEIAEHRGDLVDTDHIMPDMDDLKKAVEAGKDAAIKGNEAY